MYINKSSTVAPAAAATLLASAPARLAPAATVPASAQHATPAAATVLASTPARLASLPCPCPCSHVLVLQHATPASAHATLLCSSCLLHATAADTAQATAVCSMPPAAALRWSSCQAVRWLWLHGVKTI